MSPIERIRHGWTALMQRAWGEDCPAHDPVPESSRCAALDCEAVRLTALRIGEYGTVTCLEEPETRQSCKLASLGVLPGVRVELLQRWPTYVFRAGHTQLATDTDLARRIRVRTP